jgi:hypothetical protein
MSLMGQTPRSLPVCALHRGAARCHSRPDGGNFRAFCEPARPCRTLLDAGDRSGGGGPRGLDPADFMAGRLGVDAIALVSMSAALVLRQPLAGAVVALMYSGGNVLEEIAVARVDCLENTAFVL